MFAKRNKVIRQLYLIKATLSKLKTEFISILFNKNDMKQIKKNLQSRRIFLVIQKQIVMDMQKAKNDIDRKSTEKI